MAKCIYIFSFSESRVTFSTCLLSVAHSIWTIIFHIGIKSKPCTVLASKVQHISYVVVFSLAIETKVKIKRVTLVFQTSLNHFPHSWSLFQCFFFSSKGKYFKRTENLIIKKKTQTIDNGNFVKNGKLEWKMKIWRNCFSWFESKNERIYFSVCQICKNVIHSKLSYLWDSLSDFDHVWTATDIFHD